MNIRKRGKAVAVGVAVAAFGIGGVLTANPAAASGGVCTVGDHCSGNVTFKSHGEIFTIHDYNKDGHGVYGELEYWNGSSWIFVDEAYNRKGYDAGPLVLNESIAEGRTVRYEACLSEGYRLFHCSHYYKDKA